MQICYSLRFKWIDISIAERWISIFQNNARTTLKRLTLCQTISIFHPTHTLHAFVGSNIEPERLTWPSDNKSGASFCVVWVNIGWSLIPSKHCPAINPTFLANYCFHRVEFLSCSSIRLAGSHEKNIRWACVLWMINPLKVLETRLLYLPDLMHKGECRAKCRDCLTCSPTIHKMSNIWFDNVLMDNDNSNDFI